MKHRILAVIGFIVGAATVLVSSPPSLLTAPDNFDSPLVPEEPSPSSSPLVTPSPSANSATVAASPTKTANTSPSTSKTTVTTATTRTSTTVTTVTKPSVSATLTGDVFSAGKYGQVQVQIIVSSGIVTSAKALLFPDGDSRSSSISASALPVLIEQTLQAKNSSDIQGVSGASYTSAAWIDSLQSALAKV